MIRTSVASLMLATRLSVLGIVFLGGLLRLSSAAVAADTLDSLTFALQNAESLEDQADALLDIARYYEPIYADSTWQYAQQALAASQSAAYDHGTAQAYLQIASYYGGGGHYNFDSLDRYFSLALALYQRNDDSLAVADSYFYLSTTCYENDNYPLAHNYGETAANLYLRLGEEQRRGYALAHLGRVENYMGNNALAMKYCTTAQRIFDAIEQENEKAALFKTMGSINLDLRNYDKAKDFFLQSVGLAGKHNDVATLSDAYVGMGQALRATQEYDDALNYFNRSLALHQRGDSKMSDLNTSYAYYHIGKTYVLQGHNEEAISLLDEALTTAEQYEDIVLQARSLLELGKAYYNLQELDLSFTYLNEAAQQARGLKGTYANVILQECYLNLAKYYNQVGNLEEALVNFRRYSLEQERMYQEQASRQVAEMQTVYEVDEKTSRIESLQQLSRIRELEYDQRKLVNYVLISGILFLFGLGLVFYSKYRLKTQANRKLEKQKASISQQRQKIERQRDEIVLKSQLLEENSRDIKASIEYARRIQMSLLPARKQLRHLFPESLIFFRPKDIVSGDFYWLHETENTVILGVLDCTGHGVPGAFMTVLANTILNQLALENKMTSPNVVLTLMDTHIREALRQQDAENPNNDGLDMAICFVDRRTRAISYSGAQMPMYCFRQGELHQLSPDRFFIGGNYHPEKCFTNQSLQLCAGDTFYLASDGFQDQFGGPNDKKFMRRRFKELLVDLQSQRIAQQHQEIERTFYAWKGEQVQTDDVLVVGVRV
jgi:serine phosphatase RsbU (regulator of sigma subunit)